MSGFSKLGVRGTNDINVLIQVDTKDCDFNVKADFSAQLLKTVSGIPTRVWKVVMQFGVQKRKRLGEHEDMRLEWCSASLYQGLTIIIIIIKIVLTSSVLNGV